MLVIESHTDLRATLHDLLDANGWFVMSTGRSGDAVTLARGSSPQLVLLDLQLDDVRALARQVRAICPRAVILGTTTNPVSSLVDGARAAGVDAILLKPFELDFAQLAFLVEPFN